MSNEHLPPEEVQNMEVDEENVFLRYEKEYRLKMLKHESLLYAKFVYFTNNGAQKPKDAFCSFACRLVVSSPLPRCSFPFCSSFPFGLFGPCLCFSRCVLLCLVPCPFLPLPLVPSVGSALHCTRCRVLLSLITPSGYRKDVRYLLQ